METIINYEKEYSRRNYFNNMIDLRKIFVGYGRWLEQSNICGQGSIESYEKYLTEGKIIENENLINSFVGKLETGEYKAILYNEQSPILEDNIGIINFILDDLNEDSLVELIDNDTIVIHTENETIKLKGYENMSDGEIIARKYLDSCDYGLIIKDSLDQIELREDSFIEDIMKYYNKCKDIVNIRIVPEDDENYKMNWDCIIVKYKNSDKEEIWQRA